MPTCEYKVVPAPAKGLKAKGVKTPEARFANALETVMNSMAADGWTYLRADILPCEERSGLRGSKTVYHSMLVFSRTIADEAPVPAPVPAPQVIAAPVVDTIAEPQEEPETETPADTDAESRQSLWSESGENPEKSDS